MLLKPPPDVKPQLMPEHAVSVQPHSGPCVAPTDVTHGLDAGKSGQGAVGTHACIC